MTTRIVTDANGRKHITNEPLLHSPQRTWVNATTWRGLTDEERKQVINTNTSTDLWHMAKDIEDKLRIKNEHI